MLLVRSRQTGKTNEVLTRADEENRRVQVVLFIFWFRLYLGR
jgi:hypothetical protein